jgi:hypothetical protein
MANINSIVDYLKSTGQASDFQSRLNLAKEKGITNYTGTAEQNNSLLGMVKNTTPINSSLPSINDNTINAELLKNNNKVDIGSETTTPVNIPNDTQNIGFKNFQDYISSLVPPTSNAEEYKSIYGGIDTPEQIAKKESDVKISIDKINSLNAEIQGIVDSATQANLTLESEAGTKDVTSAFLGRKQQEIDRQETLKILPLQSQVLVEQAVLTGNKTLLEQATNKIDKYFTYKIDDNKEQYDYRNKIIDKFYNFMTEQEKSKADELKTKNAYQHDIDMSNLESAKDIAKMAMENGQPDLASQITKLDVTSETFKDDLASLQSQIVKKVDPTEELDLMLKQLQVQKAQSDLEASSLKTQTEKLSQEKANEESKTTIKEKINTIDDLLKSGLPAVGPNLIARADPLTVFTGNTQNFIASVDKLISEGTLNTLLELKKAGGTLGALSDQERIMLRNAFSKIGSWEIKDKEGNVKGYNINQNSFKNELNTIRTLSERALNSLNETVENNYLDNVDSFFKGQLSSPYGAYGL